MVKVWRKKSKGPETTLQKARRMYNFFRRTGRYSDAVICEQYITSCTSSYLHSPYGEPAVDAYLALCATWDNKNEYDELIKN